jgi:hypothetical protein
MLVKSLILCLSIIVLLEVLSPQPIYNEAFGSSPSFGHQEISDPKNDWKLVTQPSSYQWQESNGTKIKVDTENNMQECTDQKKLLLAPNIAAVTYLSDGSSLNGTIWLTSPLEVLPFHKVGYTISIDFSSFYDRGTDYYVTFSKSPYNQTWTRIIEETSSSMYQKRTINVTEYTDLINYGQRYIPISFNLSYLNFPSQYKIIFTAWDQFLNKNHKFCYFQDVSTWVQIPPPKYTITTLPTSAVLRPQEEKEIELSIKSIAIVASVVSLNSPRIEGLDLSFTPDKLFVAANGTSSSIMKIKVLDNDDAKHYKKSQSVPIYATISFPTAGRIFNTTTTMTNEESGNKIINSIFILEILPPLTFLDYLKILADQVAAPLGTIYTFIATLITALVTVSSTFIIRKKRKQKKE